MSQDMSGHWCSSRGRIEWMERGIGVICIKQRVF